MKRIAPCIYLYQQNAVRNLNNKEVVSKDVVGLAKEYEEFGADELIILDLSNGDAEHDAALDIIKDVCSNVSIPVLTAGNIKREEDVKKILYAGCAQAVLNFDKQENIDLAKDASLRFGKDKLSLAFTKPETLTLHRQLINTYLSDTIWITEKSTDVNPDYLNDPTIAVLDDCTLEGMIHLLKHPAINGISGNAINDNAPEIMSIKSVLKEDGILVNVPEGKLSFSDLKVGENGLIPVVVQDYKTDEVLMVAYMNEESFNKTLSSGKMTYYSRSRQELWVKGETSGHYQYVQSLKADCDFDTLLAKVRQIGVACHTGAKSCFFRDIYSKEIKESENPLRVFEDVYKVIQDRKVHPKEGSYTNYLFEKGLDKILKKLGEEATEIVIAAKNPNTNEVKYEISDFLYHMMVLMVEQGVTWEEITTELANR